MSVVRCESYEIHDTRGFSQIRDRLDGRVSLPTDSLPAAEF